MQSFYNVLAYDIKTNYTKHDRAYYETVIATWLLKNYLTSDEADKLLVLLDQYYPKTTNETTSNNSTVTQ
jgi:L-rhamnose isomerase